MKFQIMTQGLFAPFEELLKESNTDLISDTEKNGKSSKSVYARDSFTFRENSNDAMNSCKKEKSASNNTNTFGKNNHSCEGEISRTNISGKLELKSRKISEKLLR